jgi:hypothetical protein
MKSSSLKLLLFLALVIAPGFVPASAHAQGYRPGDIVNTNFGFVNRYRWTNDNGQVFTTNDVFRLSDFDGRIVFFVFFDVW